MPSYRITIRYGSPRQQYAMIDVHAPSLRQAMIDAAAQVPDDADATADLAEIRVQRDPDDREFTPG